MYVYRCICMYIYVYICLCIYIYILCARPQTLTTNLQPGTCDHSESSPLPKHFPDLRASPTSCTSEAFRE